MTGV
jgi:hypothetical protein